MQHGKTPKRKEKRSRNAVEQGIYRTSGKDVMLPIMQVEEISVTIRHDRLVNYSASHIERRLEHTYRKNRLYLLLQRCHSCCTSAKVSKASCPSGTARFSRGHSTNMREFIQENGRRIWSPGEELNTRVVVLSHVYAPKE